MPFYSIVLDQRLKIPLYFTKENFNEQTVLDYFQNNDRGRLLISCLNYSLTGLARISDEGKYHFQQIQGDFLEYNFENKEILIGELIRVTTKYLIIELGGFKGYLLKNQISNNEVFFDVVSQRVTIGNDVLMRVGDILKVMTISMINTSTHPLYTSGLRVGLSIKRADLGVLQ